MRMTCEYCRDGTTYEPSTLTCPIDKSDLVPVVEEDKPDPSGSGDPTEPTPPADSPPAPPGGRSWTTETCWNCGAYSINPDNTECLQCRKRLVPPRLLLTVGRESLPRPDRSVELDPGESAELGREEGPHAALFEDFPNVSRRHARIGVDADGTAWIEPYESTNGTFHGPGPGGLELDPGVRRPLVPDEAFRFARDATITVLLYAMPDT